MSTNQKKENKKIKKWPFIIGAVLVIGIAVALPLLNGPAMALDIPKSITADYGIITTTVVGTGNLENPEPEKMKALSELEYDEVLVEAGDRVQAGGVIAKVNADSVRDRISAVQTELDTLDQQITASKDSATDKYLSTYVEGRIKEIYAEEGDTVQSVIKEHGALALLSVDGKMKVAFETAESLKQGEGVRVLLPDGTVKDGTVSGAGTGKYTVTFPDYEVTAGDTIIVEKNDWTYAGEGRAEINEPLMITAADGVVEGIYYTAGDYVYSGTSLFYLTDTVDGNGLASLLSERKELTDELSTLLRLSESYELTAEFDGMVAEVVIQEKDAESPAAATQTEVLSTQAQAKAGTETAAAEAASESTALWYYPDKEMSLSISIDELDILNVEEGQTAVIVFDAIDGEEFEGTITSLEKSATVTNGVAKYKAVITLPKNERMRAGMNATATITIEEKENALLIPVEALQEYGENVYVYTSYNGESGVLSGDTEVTTGLSDGEQVEITEGLSSGDTVYYFVKQSDSAFDSVRFGMGSPFGGNRNTQTAAGGE